MSYFFGGAVVSGFITWLATAIIWASWFQDLNTKWKDRFNSRERQFTSEQSEMKARMLEHEGNIEIKIMRYQACGTCDHQATHQVNHKGKETYLCQECIPNFMETL